MNIETTQNLREIIKGSGWVVKGATMTNIPEKVDIDKKIIYKLDMLLS